MQWASKIIGVDVNDNKAAKGKVFGMTDFINPQSHPDQRVSDLMKDMTEGLGVDYSFECTGVAPLPNEALEATKAALGTTVLIGVGEELTQSPFRHSNNAMSNFEGSLFGGV